MADEKKLKNKGAVKYAGRGVYKNMKFKEQYQPHPSTMGETQSLTDYLQGICNEIVDDLHKVTVGFEGDISEFLSYLMAPYFPQPGDADYPKDFYETMQLMDCKRYVFERLSIDERVVDCWLDRAVDPSGMRWLGNTENNPIYSNPSLMKKAIDKSFGNLRFAAKKLINDGQFMVGVVVANDPDPEKARVLTEKRIASALKICEKMWQVNLLGMLNGLYEKNPDYATFALSKILGSRRVDDTMLDLVCEFLTQEDKQPNRKEILTYQGKPLSCKFYSIDPYVRANKKYMSEVFSLVPELFDGWREKSLKECGLTSEDKFDEKNEEKPQNLGIFDPENEN